MSILPNDRATRDPAGHDCNYNPAELQFASIIGECNAAGEFPRALSAPPPALRRQLNRDTLRSVENARLPPPSTGKQRLRRLI